MTPSDLAPATRPTWLARTARTCWRVLRALGLVLVVLWASLAIVCNLPGAWGIVFALVFAVQAAWAWWPGRRPRWRLVSVGLFLIVAVWFASLSPSNDRDWRREVAVLPRAHIDGDRVRLTGVRDFEYRSLHDFTERYIEREVDISHLTSLDFFVSYWQVGPVGHTFVSFNFDNAPPVCISIETRPEVGEDFAPIASLFKQFELIYVVGEERDLVGSRIVHRPEETLLYRVRTSPKAAQRLFRVYLERINELADEPEWYHLLKNNCTLNIVRYANRAGRTGGFHIGHLLNGWADRYLFASGFVDTSMPFAELRARSWISDAVRAAIDEPDFSRRIRAGLPGIDAPAEAK